MKNSKYNIIFKNKDNTLIFNTLTGTLAEIEDNTIKIIKNIENISLDNIDIEQKKLISDMKDHGFIIEDDVDEIAFLKHKFFKDKYVESQPSVTILPTTACNCCCFYCFEESKLHQNLTDAVKKAIYKQIDLLTKNKEKLRVTWFGGEPLLAIHDIYQMSQKIIEICDKNNIDYSSGIITNGVLIDDDILKKLVDSKVTTVHFTLDGTPDKHDKIRKLHNGQGTFWKIIENIKLCLKYNLLVDIDIHINLMTDDEIESLLYILKKEGLENCHIGFGRLINYSENINECDLISTDNYGKRSSKYEEFLYKIGLNQKYYLESYPSPKNNMCTAGKLNSFVVDPSGTLYSCWPDIGQKEKSIGNILDIKDVREISNYNKLKYILYSPFEYDKCKNCNILPICMGGCINRGLLSNSPQCTSWKYNLIQTLQYIYDIESNK